MELLDALQQLLKRFNVLEVSRRLLYPTNQAVFKAADARRRALKQNHAPQLPELSGNIDNLGSNSHFFVGTSIGSGCPA